MRPALEISKVSTLKVLAKEDAKGRGPSEKSCFRALNSSAYLTSI